MVRFKMNHSRGGRARLFTGLVAFVAACVAGRFVPATVRVSELPGAPPSAFAASHPDTARAMRAYRQGLAYYGEGRYVEALRKFQDAALLHPNDAEIRFAQGLAFMKLQEPARARDQFRKVLERAPDHARANYDMGLVLSSLGDTVSARTHLLRAQALEPRLVGVRQALSRLAETQGDKEAAIAWMRGERLVSPDSAQAHARLGVLFLANEQPDSALASLDRAVALAPRLVPAQLERAKTLDRLGRPAESADAYGAALEVDSLRADVWMARGNALVRAERPADALASFDRAAAIDTNDARAAFNRGVVLEEMERNDEALAAYAEAASRDTAYADPHLNAGSLLARLGRKVEARRELERFLALAPDAPQAAEIRKAVATLSGKPRPSRRPPP